MNLKNIIAPALVIALMAALLLGASCGLSGIRAANVQAEHVAMMKLLLPGSESFVREAYAGDDAAVRSVHKAENGYVIETSVDGYAGEMTLMIGVNSDGHVTGLVVRDMAETLGLGGNAMSDAGFLAQFLDTAGEAAVGENVDALTGATVTSKAVVRAVNSAIAVVTGVDAASAATSWGG